MKTTTWTLAMKMVSGVDVWLNTPMRPREASGTSGMKAAHNGVMNFSVLDGWWIEGHIEGFTGWSIGLTRPSQRLSPRRTRLTRKICIRNSNTRSSRYIITTGRSGYA